MRVAFAVRTKTLIILVFAALLAACASPYSPKGLTGGYTEREIDSHTFTVTFDGNGYASKELVLNYWINRCAELTISHGYQYFALLPATPKVGAAQPQEDLLPNERLGRPATHEAGTRAASNLGGWGFVPVRSGPTYIYVPSYSGAHTVSTWHKTGTIEMYHSKIGAFTATKQYALHAQTVLEMLKPYVQSAGKSPAPSVEELLETATGMKSPLPRKP